MGNDFPRRQNLRLKGWNYATPGCYFVTVCARERREVFGAVANGRVILNACGQIADTCWRDIPEHFPSMRVDEHVVMPNHIHGDRLVVGHLNPEGLLSCILSEADPDKEVVYL